MTVVEEYLKSRKAPKNDDEPVDLSKSMHLILSALLERDDTYVDKERPRQYRELVLDARSQALLKTSAIVNLFLAAFDSLYECDPLPSFATVCHYTEPHGTVKVVESISLLVLLGGTGLEVLYRGRTNAMKDYWLLLVVGGLTFSICILVGHTFIVELGGKEGKDGDTMVRELWLVRAILRPMAFLHYFPAVRVILTQHFAILPRVLPIFCMLMCIVVVFAMFGRLLVLDPDMPGNDYGLPGNGFSSLSEAIVTCFWWAFTNNGPEPGNQEGRPGMKGGSFWGFFWTVYTFAQVFCVSQIITAAVFDEFSDVASKKEEERKERQQAFLTSAFRVMQRGGRVRFSDLKQVVGLLHRFFPGKRRLSARMVLSQESHVDLDRFKGWIMGTCGSECEETAVESEEGKLTWKEKVQLALVSGTATRLFHLVAMCNGVVVVSTAENHLVRGESIWTNVAVVLYLVISVMYLGDVVLGLWVHGLIGFLRLRLSFYKVRVLLTLTSCVFVLVHSITNSVRALSIYYQFHAALLLHLLLVLDLFPAFKRVVQVMGLFGPRLRDLLVANLCLMYSWSVIGLYLTEGKFTTSNEELQNYSGGTLFTMNFNSVGNGIYTLFMAIYGNNMQQILQPLVIVGGWPMLLLYSVFYLFGSMVTGNILVSSILDLYSKVPQNLKNDAKVAPQDK